MRVSCACKCCTQQISSTKGGQDPQAQVRPRPRCCTLGAICASSSRPSQPSTYPKKGEADPQAQVRPGRRCCTLGAICASSSRRQRASSAQSPSAAACTAAAAASQSRARVPLTAPPRPAPRPSGLPGSAAPGATACSRTCCPPWQAPRPGAALFPPDAWSCWSWGAESTGAVASARALALHGRHQAVQHGHRQALAAQDALLQAAQVPRVPSLAAGTPCLRGSLPTASAAGVLASPFMHCGRVLAFGSCRALPRSGAGAWGPARRHIGKRHDVQLQERGREVERPEAQVAAGHRRQVRQHLPPPARTPS